MKDLNLTDDQLTGRAPIEGDLRLDHLTELPFPHKNTKGLFMDFIFSIKNHYFEKGTPWVELDKIKQRSWFLSVDIEDDESVPCYDTEHELRISKAIDFKSVKILAGKTQATHPYWDALLDMSYTELRDVTFKDLPGESGIYMLDIWFDYDGEELNFGDNFKKLCEYRHKWNDGWVCSKCAVRKADWVEAKKEAVKV